LWITQKLAQKMRVIRAFVWHLLSTKKVIHKFVWISMWITCSVCRKNSYPQISKSYPHTYPHTYPHAFSIDFQWLSELSTYPHALLLRLLLYIYKDFY
jgi:hypothetical protein